MVFAIVAAEVMFWVLLVLGLLLRYPLRRARAGAFALAAVPAVDALLLVASTIDLARGGSATGAHALAAVYLAVSVVHGPALVRWANVRFAHRFAGGPPPAPKPVTAAGRTRKERRAWLGHATSWAIGCALLLLATLVVGDADRSAALTHAAGLWTVVLAIDGAFSLPPQAGASS